jgi:hypothetical protein
MSMHYCMAIVVEIRLILLVEYNDLCMYVYK